MRTSCFYDVPLGAPMTPGKLKGTSERGTKRLSVCFPAVPQCRRVRVDLPSPHSLPGTLSAEPMVQHRKHLWYQRLPSWCERYRPCCTCLLGGGIIILARDWKCDKRLESRSASNISYLYSRLDDSDKGSFLLNESICGIHNHGEYLCRNTAVPDIYTLRRPLLVLSLDL